MAEKATKWSHMAQVDIFRRLMDELPGEMACKIRLLWMIASSERVWGGLHRTTLLGLLIWTQTDPFAIKVEGMKNVKCPPDARKRTRRRLAALLHEALEDIPAEIKEVQHHGD